MHPVSGFFFQAEDGIRDVAVTGVQTCALPIFNAEMDGRLAQADVWCADNNFYPELGAVPEIGRLFNADEENLSAAAPAQVAVLSYGFWERHYEIGRAHV